MQEHPIKTTLTFSPQFIQRLRKHAKERKMSMSRVVESGVEPLLTKYERRHLNRMYRAMEKWMGSDSSNVTDASQTIDETLYGEEGVWKGQRAK